MTDDEPRRYLTPEEIAERIAALPDEVTAEELDELSAVRRELGPECPEPSPCAHTVPAMWLCPECERTTRP